MKQALQMSPITLLQLFPHWDFSSMLVTDDVSDGVRRMYLGIKHSKKLKSMKEAERRLLKPFTKPLQKVVVLSESGPLNVVIAWNEFCEQVEKLG